MSTRERQPWDRDTNGDTIQLEAYQTTDDRFKIFDPDSRQTAWITGIALDLEEVA